MKVSSVRQATPNRAPGVAFRALETLGRPLPAAASYVVVFGLLAAPLLPAFGQGIPHGPNRQDEELIVWILSWVSHALGTDPLSIFDANINHPAPAQLTSSDHFFSSQLLFAPPYALLGNPLLAANLAAWATYPLAAWAMQRLVLRIGGHASIAWIAGFIFALGPRRVPFNIHILQYANLFLPFVALCLVRLREEPSARRTVALGVAFGLGVLSSFYMALLVGLVAIVWGIAEGARPGPQRARYVTCALAAAAVAIAVALVAIAPYFHRLGGIGQPLRTAAFHESTLVAAARGLVPGATPYPLALAVLASLLVTIVGAARGVASARRCLGPAAILSLLGIVLMPGIPESLAPALEDTPLRFFNYTARFQLLFHFGGVLLLAAALESIGTLFGARALAALAVALLGFVAYDRGLALGREGLRRIPALSENATAYQSLRTIALEHGEGPLLELPTQGRLPGDDRVVWLDTDAMLGSTLHWLPLVTGYTGHHPEHRPLVLSTISSLSMPGALRDLFDLTGVRWVLIRPPRFWSQEQRYRDVVSQLARAPEQKGIWPLEDWILVEVAPPDASPRWIDALSRGTSTDDTLLGTPWRRIPDEDAVGRLQLIRARREPLAPGQGFPIVVSIENTGTATWPVAVRPQKVLRLQGAVPLEPFRPQAVTLVARWVPLFERGGDPPENAERAALRRDVPPGDVLTQTILLLAPDEPGEYQLEIGLDQIEGTSFEDPRNERVLLRVEVERGKVAQHGTRTQDQTH